MTPTIHIISQPERKKINQYKKKTDFLTTILSIVSNQKLLTILVSCLLLCWGIINVVFLDDSYYNSEHGLQNAKPVSSHVSNTKQKYFTDDEDDEPFLLLPPTETGEFLWDDLIADDIDDDGFSSTIDDLVLQDDEFIFGEPSLSDKEAGDFRVVGIRAVLETMTKAKTLKDSTTPQGKAFDWILNGDKRQLYSDDSNLIQRYALAVLFYSLNGENWHHGDLHWLSGVHECHWTKTYKRRPLGVVECDKQKRITRIDLAESNLLGVLPSEIGHLSELRSLDIQNNRIFGHIPPHLGNLSKLEILTANGNKLSGTIPTELGKLRSATEILIHFNELSGSVHESICDLKTENSLWNLWTDCASSLPPLFCNCCTVCCNGLSSCAPP